MNLNYIILDVDGTLTDGKIYYSSNNVTSKSFCTKDGMGISIALDLGIRVVFLSGNSSKSTLFRANQLNITDCFLGVKDKKRFLLNYFEENKIDSDYVLYIGDDINDLPAMSICGKSASPSDATDKVKNSVDFVSSFSGGNGAVRDILEELIFQVNIELQNDNYEQ